MKSTHLHIHTTAKERATSSSTLFSFFKKMVHVLVAFAVAKSLPLINTPFIFVYVSFVFGQAWSSHIRPLERVSHLHPTINNDFSSCFCTFVKWQKYKEDFVLSIGIPNIMPQTNITGNVLSWDMKSARLLAWCVVLRFAFVIFFTLLRSPAHSLRSVFIYFSHIFLLIQFLHFKHSFCHLVVYAFTRFHEKSLWIQLMKTIQTLKNGCSSVTDLSWIYQNCTRALTLFLSVCLYSCLFGMMLFNQNHHQLFQITATA